MLTPHDVQYCRADDILAHRQQALNHAFVQHPERFKYIEPTIAALPKAVWINPPVQTQEVMNDPSN